MSYYLKELPCWLSGKEPACKAGNTGLIPGSGRSPVEGNGNPLQYSCWEIPWTEEPGGLQSLIFGMQFWKHQSLRQQSSPWNKSLAIIS